MLAEERVGAVQRLQHQEVGQFGHAVAQLAHPRRQQLRALPVAPRQLPFHAGFHYFELDRGGELWKQLERSGSLALHVAGDFPGLELELWAIRQ